MPDPDAVPAPSDDGGDPRPGAADEVLSPTELAMLELERQRWKYAGAKEARVRQQFGMSLTRYHQVLNALIDKPQALAADPVTVHRLRRLRETRRANRTPSR